MTKGGIERPSTELRRKLDTKTVYLTVTHPNPSWRRLSAGAGRAVTIPRKAARPAEGAMRAKKNELSLPSTTTCSNVSLILLPPLASSPEGQNGAPSCLRSLQPLSWVRTEAGGRERPSQASSAPHQDERDGRHIRRHADSHRWTSSQAGPTRPQGLPQRLLPPPEFPPCCCPPPLLHCPVPARRKRAAEAESTRLPCSEATGAPHACREPSSEGGAFQLRDVT